MTPHFSARACSILALSSDDGTRVDQPARGCQKARQILPSFQVDARLAASTEASNPRQKARRVAGHSTAKRNHHRVAIGAAH
jgi:hypothetical protein